MDGNEIAKRIRKSDKADVPTIAVSRYDVEADNELFTLSLEKPFNVQALKDVIKSIEGYQKGVQT